MVQWFPNKVHDLNGYKMNIRLNLSDSDVGIRATKLAYLSTKVTSILAQAMTFQVDLQLGQNDTLIFNSVHFSYDQNLRTQKIGSIKAVLPYK